MKIQKRIELTESQISILASQSFSRLCSELGKQLSKDDLDKFLKHLSELIEKRLTDSAD